MNTLIIPIHSFVDLITNSSSEIFVAADKKTVKAIKTLVENLISAAGGTAKADDLFTFDLGYKCYTPEYDEVYLTKDEIKAKKAELKSTVKSVDEGEWEFGTTSGEEEYKDVAVRVTVKDDTNISAKAAAEVLSNLTSLFQIDSTYN